MGTMVPDIMEAMLPGPYKLAAMGFESTAVITNKASYVAYRGPWASETFIRERVLDLIAKDLGLDPASEQARQMIDDPDIFRAAKRPNGQPATMKQCEQPSACEPKMLLTSAVDVVDGSSTGT